MPTLQNAIALHSSFFILHSSFFILTENLGLLATLREQPNNFQPSTLEQS
ncbi:MAG: hypothetical protein F6J90_15875 [Moorea sp. SIOASIH]|nr:hypothetical protein [Moorena sp. SIOASIH]NEO37727.1 hypothetical protein [Moorena sp. SIOASIH]